MKTRTNITRMSVELSKVLHHKVKSVAALHGKSIRELIIAGLYWELEEIKQKKCPFKNRGIPNAETRKVLDEIMRGEGLIKGEGLDEFFKKIGS
jgi:hypothetical protein